MREVESEAKKVVYQDNSGIDNFKKEIVDSIHSHFEKCNYET